jgi:SAM-dependent methyltransferase
MKSNNNKLKQFYAKLALENADKTSIAGRYDFDKGKEQFIVDDIVSKLDIKEKSSFFDIGCGAGLVAEYLIKYLHKLDVSLTMMDVAEVIGILKRDTISDTMFPGLKVQLLNGYFPEDFSLTGQKFDRILLYAVLYQVDNPMEIIQEAVKLLNPYGKLLLGDLPNISRKGRFLSSGNGRIFDAGYKKMRIEDLPVYKSHHDFVEKMIADPEYYSMIDDQFVSNIYQEYTGMGYDVFILPQTDNLPFSKTRHDVLICKYD